MFSSEDEIEIDRLVRATMQQPYPEPDLFTSSSAFGYGHIEKAMTGGARRQGLAAQFLLEQILLHLSSLGDQLHGDKRAGQREGGKTSHGHPFTRLGAGIRAGASERSSVRVTDILPLQHKAVGVRLIAHYDKHR